MIGPGSRVRYKFGGFTGTVLRKTHPRNETGDWLVQWDGSRAWEVNLEELPAPTARNASDEQQPASPDQQKGGST